MEFEDVWLEVRACAQKSNPAVNIDSKALGLATLSEVLEVAAITNARPTSGMWDYSCKLRPGEADQIKKVIEFNSKTEDEKSISLSANVAYRGACYVLTLFTFKRLSQ